MGAGDMVPMPKPVHPERVKAAFVSLVRRPDVKAPDGRAVTGVGFNSWTDGGSIEVVVFLLVAPAIGPNVYAPDRVGTLTQRKLETFSLPAQLGAHHDVVEMKDYGLTPLGVSVERFVGPSAR
jgi:hypothetical protein